ncbi:unnamed protein product [Clavelina lepadiformis]|uniref:Uncharacterized protein n=1 Tax=Clavelina lepadiformis TaxID=159417 RepID=A0ABP0FSY0_CLALP
MGRYSSSDSENSDRGSSSKRKTKSSRKRRSRSSSYDSSKRKHGKSRRNRSRSRSSSYEERGTTDSRRKRSRSRDKSRHRSSRNDSSTKRSKKSREQSPSAPRRKKHVDAVMGVSTGTMKDVMDILPGFSKMAPAEQSRIRIQRALQAAVDKEEDTQDVVQTPDETTDDTTTVRNQIERAKAIQAIEEGDDDLGVDFLPSHFRSTNKTKKKSTEKEQLKTTFMERESTHELAMFGHASMLTMDEAMKRKKETDEAALYKAKKRIDFKQRDPRTLLAPELLIGPDKVAARWRSKLASLRQRFVHELNTNP